MMRAPYASDPAKSRGRKISEAESPSRTPYQRDKDRVVHAAAFRRLKHKTQVFVYHEGDHYRTRLTHSLEVAQIARSIARALGLDEDLSETCALAHDLGHPPFGHAGEEALAQCMSEFGGFDHNEQTFRVLTLLERRYADFDGLNLTWESLEGIVKHNGPLIGEKASLKALAQGLPPTIALYSKDYGLDLSHFTSAEAQVAALADDIAYNNHDLDDGLRAKLFDLEDLQGIPLVGDIFAECQKKWPGLEEQRLVHEAIRRVIDFMVNDVLVESGSRLNGLSTPDSVRQAPAPVIAFSEDVQKTERALKSFLFEHMYRHYRVNRMSLKAQRIVRELFEMHLTHPECLPPEWYKRAEGKLSNQTARVVCDYIAGMTDKYALETHRVLFGAD